MVDIIVYIKCMYAAAVNPILPDRKAWQTCYPLSEKRVKPVSLFPKHRT